jgi:N-acetylmuramoyl-L-alanine amidase
MKRFFILVLACVFLVTSVLPQPAFAAPNEGDITNPSAEDQDKSGDESSLPTSFTDDPAYFSTNDVEFFSNQCSDSAAAGTTVQLSGADNTEKVLNFFMGKGLSLAQAAGFVGNMMQESGVDPKKIQGGAIAPDDYQPVNGVGFGLVQWTFTARQGPLMEKARSMTKKVVDIEVQLEYIWDELNSGYAHTLRDLKNTQDPVEAAVIVHGPPNPGYEASADSPADVRSVRGGNAQKVYDKYKDAPPAGGLTTGPDGSTSTNTGGTTIAIDPGHSTQAIHDIEPTTGAELYDYPNGAEDEDAWQVSQKVKAGLEEKNYKVVLLKTSKDERVNFKERADRAKAAGAALAVSVHTTPPEGSAVFNQFNGGYREGPNGKMTFENDQTAQKSTQYSEAIARKRTEIEGHNVPVKQNTFDGRPGIASGNLAWVENLSPDVPWAYNEYSGSNGEGGAVPLTNEQKDAYAKGIIEGIVAANPSGGAQTTTGGCDSGNNSSGAVSGDLAATVKGYAWPQPKPSGFTERTRDYVAAVDKAKAAGLYIGGCDGVDCGAFVTLLIRDSGFDPGYNADGKGGPTSAQEAWAKTNWESLGSGPQDPAQLKPGDVAVNSSHTFIFIGDGVFEGTNVASASLCDRAPAAGGDSPSENGFNWYRKKG